MLEFAIRDEDDEEFDIPGEEWKRVLVPRSSSYEVIDDPEAFLRLKVEDPDLPFPEVEKVIGVEELLAPTQPKLTQ